MKIYDKEIYINLKKDCIHDKGLSYYDNNYYHLKENLLGCKALQVKYQESADCWWVTLGEIEEAFVGKEFFEGYQDTKENLVIYLD